MSNFEPDIKACVKVLQEGGTILYPTDTIWGLGCDATNEEAVAKIFSLKQRNEKKSMIVLLSDEKEIQHYAQLPSAYISELINTAAKPLTVIYPNAKNIAHNLINEDGTVAIRIVKDKFCEELINAFGKPIVSTSANTSGEPFPENFNRITVEIKSRTDFIVHYRREENNPFIPSRIIKWLRDDMITLIRE